MGGAGQKSRRSPASGFTLVEVLIAVAIIGILAAVALPVYQNYIKRSHVAEVIALAEADKLALSLFFQDNNRWPTSAEANTLLSTPADSEYLRSVKYFTPDIRVAYVLENLGSDIDGKEFLFDVNEAATRPALQWECRLSTNAALRLPEKYLPPQCRHLPGA